MPPALDEASPDVLYDEDSDIDEISRPPESHPATARPNVPVVRWRVRKKLDRITKDRFKWALALYDRHLADRKTRPARKQQLDEEVDTIISDWMEKGFKAEADLLAGDYLGDERVSRPGTFKHMIVVPGGGGREVIKIQGYGPGDSDSDTDGDDSKSNASSSTSDSKRRTSPEPLEEVSRAQDVLQFLSQAATAELDSDTCTNLDPVPLALVRQHIFSSPSGPVFCICRPCPKNSRPNTLYGPIASDTRAGATVHPRGPCRRTLSIHPPGGIDCWEIARSVWNRRSVRRLLPVSLADNHSASRSSEQMGHCRPEQF